VAGEKGEARVKRAQPAVSEGSVPQRRGDRARQEIHLKVRPHRPMGELSKFVTRAVY
jgi:hypothetical protein